MYLATVAAYAGVSMIVEHPARATWKPQAASSWGLPETQDLARHPDVRLLTLDQCAYGADARKATTLMLIHLPELAEAVHHAPHKGKCTHRQGHTTALGRINGTTEFRTAHFKEYPPDLCRLMADSVMRHWQEILTQIPAVPLPSEWRASYCTDMTAAMGADCARKRVRLQKPPAAGTEEEARGSVAPLRAGPQAA